MKKNLDFSRTFGSVPESFDARVRGTLARLAATPPEKSVRFLGTPALRVILIAAVLLAMTATAAAVFSSQTAELYSGPNGLMDSTGGLQQDMADGLVSVSGDRTELDGVLFTLDDMVWGKDNLYASGVYRAADAEKALLLDDDMELSVFDVYISEDDRETTYAEYAKIHGLALKKPAIMLAGYLNENGERVESDRSFYATLQPDGSYRFGLMYFADADELQRIRDTGSAFVFDLTVETYDAETGRSCQTVSEEWVLRLPPREN